MVLDAEELNMGAGGGGSPGMVLAAGPILLAGLSLGGGSRRKKVLRGVACGLAVVVLALV